METNTKPTPQVKTSAQTQTQAQNDWDKREIGALWKREGKSQNYLSGHVKFSDEFGAERKLDVMIFANKSRRRTRTLTLEFILMTDPPRKLLKFLWSVIKPLNPLRLRRS